MIMMLKIGLLAVYVAGLTQWLQLLPASPLLFYAKIVTIALPVAHALEGVLMLKTVRLYKGPMLVSFLLTIVFGVLHLGPLRKAAAASP